MELRKLQATDLFIIVKIINTLGIKKIKESINVDEIKSAREKILEDGSNKNAVYKEIGTKVIMSVIDVVIENIPLIEQDLFKFMGNLANVKPEEIAKMDIGDFMDLLIAVIKKEEFKDFFGRALRLTKSE